MTNAAPEMSNFRGHAPCSSDGMDVNEGSPVVSPVACTPEQHVRHVSRTPGSSVCNLY